MAKGMGAQSIYGQPYSMKVGVSYFVDYAMCLTSLQLPEDQDVYDGNSRVPVKAGEACTLIFLMVSYRLLTYNPVMESRHEAFLEGFLPEFAALRKVGTIEIDSEYKANTLTPPCQTAATKAKLVNKLGYPSTSTFATYGYAASAHLDKDACPTTGWVTHRPDSVGDNAP